MTSKEQARRLGEQVASVIRSDKPSVFNPEDLQLIERDVLVKLLEVAKAAEALFNRDQNDRVGLSVREYEMSYALLRLRATGKVKL